MGVSVEGCQSFLSFVYLLSNCTVFDRLRSPKNTVMELGSVHLVTDYNRLDLSLYTPSLPVFDSSPFTFTRALPASPLGGRVVQEVPLVPELGAG